MIKLKDLLLEISLGNSWSDAEFFVQHHRLSKDILKEELQTWILKNFYHKRRSMLAVENPFKKNPSAIRKLVKNKVNDVWKAANTILTIRKTGIKRNDVEYKLWEKILKTQLEGTIEEYLNEIEKRDPNGGEYDRWMGKRHKLMPDFEKRLHGHLVDFFNAPMFMST
jgi:predicted DNA-binding protein YlxM (UPF0122 family)